MRLLFIKLKHIGDALLLTPTLAAARAGYPQAQIWVVVRAGSEGILAGCPAIDRVLTTAAPEPTHRSDRGWRAEWRLIRELRAQHFDYAFELSDGDRGRMLARLSGARVRCANAAGTSLGWFWRKQFHRLSNFGWFDRHRVEKDFFTVHDCLPLKLPVPSLVFDQARMAPCPAAETMKDFAVMHAGTRWQRKRWPLEKWVETGRHLLGRFANVVISAGPAADEMREAAALQEALGARTIDCAGKLNWAQLTSLLRRAKLFVGVDTAAMHLAAACQCPTVAIFGPSVESMWRPWQVAHRIVTPPGVPLDKHDPDYIQKVEQRRIIDVPVSGVIQACDELLRSAINP